MSKFTLKNQNQKSNLTQYLINLISEEDKDSYHQAMNTWWYNIRKTGGFRLTDKGYKILKDTLELDTWAVEISDSKKMNQRLLVQLDKKLNWPYYIDKKDNKILFFSSKEATLATLFGNVSSWILKND